MRKQNGYNQLGLDLFVEAPAPVAQREPGPWVAWAMDLLKSDAVILDSETTGLDNTAQMISLGIIDMQGKTLFNTFLRPTVSIQPGAQAIHGITHRQIAQAPTIAHVAGQLAQMLTGRKVLIWNADFDLRLLRQSLAAHQLDRRWVDGVTAECAMRAYAGSLGRKSVKLEGGNHTAVGDCLAVLERIKELTQG